MNDLHPQAEAIGEPLSRYRLTFEQTLLLKATLLRGQTALSAWKQWKNCVDIEILDGASYALLPQLYQNLLVHQVEDPHMGRLKGAYRCNWYVTQLQLKSLDTALTALAKTGVNTIALGDAALHCYDRDRPIISGYLLVHHDQLDLTYETLTQTGWAAPAPAPGSASLQLQGRQKNWLYIQTHLFWGTPQEEIDQAVWHYSIAPPSQQEVSLLLALLPSPTDQLLDICVRTFLINSTLSIHGLADAYLLIQTLGNAIDWRRLVAQAQRYRLILPLRNLLVALQQVLQPTIPDWVLLVLRGLPITPQELLTYQVLAEDWPLWVRSQLLLKQQSLERQWLRLRYASFPGRGILKSLLVSSKSII